MRQSSKQRTKRLEIAELYAISPLSLCPSPFPPCLDWAAGEAVDVRLARTLGIPVR